MDGNQDQHAEDSVTATPELSLQEHLAKASEGEISSLPTLRTFLERLHDKIQTIESDLSLERLKEQIEHEVDNAYGDIRNTVLNAVKELTGRVERLEEFLPSRIGKVQAMPSPSPGQVGGSPVTTTAPESGAASQQAGSTEESAGQKAPTGA